jgi:hypothetical protein
VAAHQRIVTRSIFKQAQPFKINGIKTTTLSVTIRRLEHYICSRRM